MSRIINSAGEFTEQPLYLRAVSEDKRVFKVVDFEGTDELIMWLSDESDADNQVWERLDWCPVADHLNESVVVDQHNYNTYVSPHYPHFKGVHIVSRKTFQVVLRAGVEYKFRVQENAVTPELIFKFFPEGLLNSQGATVKCEL